MRLLCAVLMLSLAGCGRRSDERTWGEFVRWYKAQPFSGPSNLKEDYGAALAARGESRAEINRKLAVVAKRAGRPEMTTLFFEKIYTSPNPCFDTGPNAFLAEAVRGVKPGSALEAAMGQGRNAIFLAGLGWDVTGYDISTAGLAAARAEAERKGVRIQAVRASHADFDFGRERWDLVVLVYSWARLSDGGFCSRVRDSLKRGGIVVVEQFNAPPGTGARGPRNALFESFDKLRVVRYEDVVAVTDWSLGKPARVGRLVAQKD